MMKRKWQRPQLQVLTRGGFQEKILSDCKTGSGAPTENPIATNIDCRQFESGWRDNYCSVKGDS